MKRFCYICGKKEEIEGLCKDCYLEKNTIIKLPDKVEIRICPKCNQILRKNSWQDLNMERYFKDLTKNKVKIKKIKLLEEKRVDNIYEITFIGDLSNKIIKEEKHKIKVHFDRSVCYRCSRFDSGYYESIIQLRGEIKEEILSFIMDKLEKSERKTFNFRLEKIKPGIDIYVGDKRVTKTIINSLKKRFNLKVKTTFKDAGFYQGKKIAKVIYAIRI